MFITTHRRPRIVRFLLDSAARITSIVQVRARAEDRSTYRIGEISHLHRLPCNSYILSFVSSTSPLLRSHEPTKKLITRPIERKFVHLAKIFHSGGEERNFRVVNLSSFVFLLFATTRIFQLELRSILKDILTATYSDVFSLAKHKHNSNFFI